MLVSETDMDVNGGIDISFAIKCFHSTPSLKEP